MITNRMTAPMRPGWLLVCLLATALQPVFARDVESTGDAFIPILSLPMEFDGTTFSTPNVVTSVSAPLCPGRTGVPGGEVVYTLRTGLPLHGIGNHIDFNLTPPPGFEPVI